MKATITSTMRVMTDDGMRRFTPGHQVEGKIATFAVENGYGRADEAEAKAKPAPKNKAKPAPQVKA